MNRSGKVHWMTLAGVAGVVAVLVIFFIGSESPSMAASRFMSALAKGDVSTLVDCSYYPEISKEELTKKWEYTTKVVGPYYMFRWKIANEKITGEKDAAVQLKVERAIDTGSSYEENYGLALVKSNNKWLVDVRSIPRPMFPGLPR